MALLGNRRIKIPKVCLKCDSDFEDDVDYGDEYKFRTRSKVLVACIRIDSYYSRFRLFINIKNFEVNLMNNIKNSDLKKMDEWMPETFKHFYLSDDRVISMFS